MPLNSASSNDITPVSDTEPQDMSGEVSANEVQEEEQPVQDPTPVVNLAPDMAEMPIDDVAVEVNGSNPLPAAGAAEPESEVEPEILAESAVDETVEDLPPASEAVYEDASPEDEMAPVDESSTADTAELAAESESTSKFRRGEIVEGKVLQTSPTEILIELDDGTEGIISGRELARMDHRSLEDLEIGGSVLVYVLSPLNRSGQAVLSLTRAMEEHDWRLAMDHHESQELYTGKVSGYNKGGLIVRFGRVRGFVPASQVSEERRARAVGGSPMERWGSMIGEDVVVKVVEVDRSRNRLILSERAAIKEYRDQRKGELLDRLEVGDIHKGHVVSLTDFGAFVDLGGADGLIHLTELSWRHVTRPDEIVKVGQEVEVQVISLDRQRRRIGLSMKALETDPWEQVVSQFQVGQLVRGTITKLTKFGAFACLDDAPEIEGLIHISELADHRVGHPREVVSENEALTLRIVKIDKPQRRMGLSLKQVDAVDYLEIDLANYDAPDEIPTLADVEEPTFDGPAAEEPDVPDDVSFADTPDDGTAEGDVE